MSIDTALIRKWAGSDYPIAWEAANEIDQLRAEVERLKAESKSQFDTFNAVLANRSEVINALTRAEARIAELEGENAAKESDLIKWRMGDYGYSERR